MPLLPPPPIEELARSLKARNERLAARPWTETIPADRNCQSCRARSERSRRTCHMPREPKPRYPSPADSGAYMPEMAARLDDDRNLTDGARRCARKLTEYVYRKDRSDRESEITVTYLMKALNRCRRTVQRYL